MPAATQSAANRSFRSRARTCVCATRFQTPSSRPSRPSPRDDCVCAIRVFRSVMPIVSKCLAPLRTGPATPSRGGAWPSA
ncbi:hypothetical protein RM53_13575 [Brevundimonas nasdae]|uniref:Uncharacterized protein n=1 Tax=Brevundimonas nasdae TaxID=172043 RepID=A0A0B4DP54_9CAUL|nr:hypothetical protein RM53_13575 [Brevundimonas nasdae]